MKFCKTKFIFLLNTFVFFIPVITLAQADFSLAGKNFKDIILYVLSIIAVLIPILFAIAFIVFFWGLSKFILNSSVQADIEKGKNYMIWGVLALFILISFRAIIGLVVGDLGFGDAKEAPQLQNAIPSGGSTIRGSGLPN